MHKKIDLIGKLLIAYIFILAICFLIYSLVVIPTNEAEKVNSIIGLLGWSATIFAPVAAFFLLDSWKEQTKYNAQLELIANMIDELSKLSLKISAVRSDENTSSYLYRMYFGNKIVNEISEIPEINMPNFSEIFQCIENIRIINLKIFLYDNQINSHVFMNKKSGRDSFTRIEVCIKGLEACFFKIKHERDMFKRNDDSPEYLDFLQQCFYINDFFYNAYRGDVNSSIDNKYMIKLNSDLDDAFSDLKDFRKSLN